MSVYKMTVDEMSVDKMPIDEMSVDEMSVDEMTCCRKYYNFIFHRCFSVSLSRERLGSLDIFPFYQSTKKIMACFTKSDGKVSKIFTEVLLIEKLYNLGV